MLATARYTSCLLVHQCMLLGSALLRSWAMQRHPLCMLSCGRLGCHNNVLYHLVPCCAFARILSLCLQYRLVCRRFECVESVRPGCCTVEAVTLLSLALTLCLEVAKELFCSLVELVGRLSSANFGKRPLRMGLAPTWCCAYLHACMHTYIVLSMESLLHACCCDVVSHSQRHSVSDPRQQAVSPVLTCTNPQTLRPSSVCIYLLPLGGATGLACPV